MRVFAKSKTGKRVQIPRCRATVSELFGGRPLCKREGLRRWSRMSTSQLASQETGAFRILNPFRVRRRVQNAHSCSLIFLLLSVAASASELSVKVVDPSSAAVPGARVSLIARRRDLRSLLKTPCHRRAVRSTSPAGFRTTLWQSSRPSLCCRIHAGRSPFRAETRKSVKLRLAARLRNRSRNRHADRRMETVKSAGCFHVDTLRIASNSYDEPIASADTVHFLPGVVLGECRGPARRAHLLVRPRRRVPL